MIYDLTFESLLIHNGLYRYHQRDMFFNANLSVGSYLALRHARRWAQIPTQVSGSRAQFWKSFWVPGAAVWTAFWLAFTAQMIWYVLAQPWSAGPRAF